MRTRPAGLQSQGPAATLCPSPALLWPQSFFAERFFTLFDSDGSGTITLQELRDALTLLIHGDPMDKLKFLFQVYDVDGKGSEGREGWGERGLSGRGQRDPTYLSDCLQTRLMTPSLCVPPPHPSLRVATASLLWRGGEKGHCGPGDKCP